MKSPYISIEVLRKNGQRINRAGSRKTRRIFQYIQREAKPECIFSVTVTYPNGNTNEGRYKSYQELVHALRAFLEKD